MDTRRNTLLEAWMAEHGYSSNSLAESVNSAVEQLTGRPGGLDGSSIRAWKAGRVKWPKSATRKALENLTGLPATALGFVPRGRTPSIPAPPQQEPDMKRRILIGGIAAAAATAVSPGTAAPRRIGMSDVDRLRKRFAEIIAGDQHHGGRLGIEQRAAALADEALSLQNTGGAGERVRRSLYECAASFRSSAMWAAIDGRRFDDATVHMREAQALAEMSGDQAIKFRIWSHAGTMYRHLGRPADALAANDVARNLHLTRRDPLFACLGHARQAATLGLTRDTTAVRRALGCAQDTLERADPDLARPLWMTAVRNGAELETLALSAHLRLGDFAQAETHAHRSLALLHPLMRRDRAINTARLAAAQLGQGEVEDTHRHGDGRPRRHRLPARPGDPHAARFRGDPARHGTRHCLRTDLDPAGGRLENHRVNTVPLVSLACSPPTGHLPWRSPRPHGLSPGSVGQGEWVGER